MIIIKTFSHCALRCQLYGAVILFFFFVNKKKSYSIAGLLLNLSQFHCVVCADLPMFQFTAADADKAGYVKKIWNSVGAFVFSN